MLVEYYNTRRWDQVTGYPTKEKLKELGLGEVADELESMGRLAYKNKK